MVTVDEIKKQVEATHPEWSDEIKQQYAERTAERINQYNEPEVWAGDPWDDSFVWALSARATQAWQDISQRADDLISDEDAKKSSWNWFLDQAANVWWSLVWWTVRAFWSMPKFWWDAVWLATWRTNFWFWDTKKRAEELEAQWVWSVWAWMTAIEEWAQKDNLTWSSDNLFAQWVDQLINNPLIFKGVWSLLKWAASTIRGVSKIWKVWNVISKAEKGVWAVASVADDATKAASKWTSFFQTVKNWAKNVVNKVAENKIINNKATRWIWEKAFNFASWSLKAVTPIIDFWTPIVRWINAATSWFKASGIWAAIRNWVSETLASWLETAGKAIANPYSYRMPRIWSYDQAQKLMWDADVARQRASDLQEFYDEHGYSLLNATSFEDNEALKKWYDEQGIPEEKRLSLDEAKMELWKSGDSFVNNLLEWTKDLLQFADPWSYNQWYYNAVQTSQSWVYNEVATSPRWRLRTSWGLSIDLNDWTITDAEWNTINADDLTDEQREDFAAAVAKIQTWDYSDVEIEWATPATEADETVNITGLNQDNENAIAIESIAQNWMLTQKTVSKLMKWNKSADAVYITTQLNETWKQFAKQLVNLYTADELNKNPSLQAKINEQLWAYQRWLNATAEVINDASSDVYWQASRIHWVYRFRDAMSQAIWLLSDRDVALINSNIYRQAIDYNNSLEEWFDQTWMKAATDVVQKTDDWIVNTLLRDDAADLTNVLWLSWLWDTAVNPNVVWVASMLWDVRSAVANNAAYLIDTAVVNFLNNNLVEWYLWKVINKGMNKIMPAKILANKQYNFMKWFTSEFSSEPLENFLDAISMVESSDTSYDFMPWLLIWALQWWMAGYAWAKSNYSSINDYFSDPKNRTDILNRMWIDISKIPDPKKKALALEVTNKMFDNVVDVMKNAYANSNYWVENLAQWLAITMINNDMAEYATDILNQAQEYINQQQTIANETNNWEWTNQQIVDIFWTTENFDAYQKGENFSFWDNFINNLRAANKTKFDIMKQRAAALVVTSQSIKWNNLQEVFDKLAPKVDINWTTVRTPLSKAQISELEATYNAIEPGTPAAQQYIMQQMISGFNVQLNTIADVLWIWEWSELRDSKKWDFKKTIKRENWERISARDYIIERINAEDNWLTQEQRAFIANMLFRTSSLWINSYFTDSWALSRLWKDFFNSVLPALEDSKAAENRLSFIMTDQVSKISKMQKSKADALEERWEETHKIDNWNVIQKTAEEILKDNWDTRENWVSGKTEDVEQLTENANYVKAHLPRMERKWSFVNIPLNKDADLWDLWAMNEWIKINWIDIWKDENTDANINSDSAKASYQRIRFTYKDKTTKEYYAVPQLNYAIRNQAEDEQADDWFNSFVLLSADPEDWERITKRSSVIFRWPDETFSNSKNVIFDVLDKDWNPVKGNRVINFTHNPESGWRLATTIQLNRLSKENRNSAYSKWHVFVNQKHNEEINWKKKNYWRTVELPNGKVVDYDTREIYTISDMIMDDNATGITIWWTTYGIWNKLFEREHLRTQNTTDEITETTPEDIQEKNETLIRWEWGFTPRTKAWKDAIKKQKEIDKKTEEIHEKWVEEALSDTDDPTVSEEESINNYNKSIDPRVYEKAKTKIQLIATESDWFKVWDYIDLNLLSQLDGRIVDDWSAESENYKTLVKKCIISDFKDISDKDAYDLINKLYFIQNNFDYLIQQWYDEYLGVYFAIDDLIFVLNQWLWDKVRKIIVSDEHALKEFNWKSVDDFVDNVMPDWYSPVEIWISADKYWHIIWINIGNNATSLSRKWTVLFTHSHPNSSFFSLSDIQWAYNQWLEQIWLILPGWVHLEYVIDDYFETVTHDNNGNIISPWMHESLDSTIMQAMDLAANSWVFDTQKWWDFDALAKDYILAFNDKWYLTDSEKDAFRMQAKAIAYNVFNKIWKQLKQEAIDSWDINKYYFFNKSWFSRESQALASTTANPLLADSLSQLTDSEKQTTERYLDQKYEVIECRSDDDFKNLRKTAKANDWIYTLRWWVNHFGNPWSFEWNVWTIKANSAEEAVNNYFAWLTGRDFQKVEPNRRQWIVNQILSWELKWKKIYYYTKKVTKGWNWWVYSVDWKYWNTEEYSYKEDYNELWNRAYNHAMVLWMLINMPQYIQHANRLHTVPEVEKTLKSPILKKLFKQDLIALGNSNKIIWYQSSKLFTPLLFKYKEWNKQNSNVYDYKNSDVVFVNIPHYTKINSSVSDEEYQRSVRDCINATLAKVKLAINAWAQFTTWMQASANEKELYRLLKDNWYAAYNMNNRYILWKKVWTETNKVNNPSLSLQQEVEAILSNDEKKIVDQIEEEWLPDPNTNNIEEKNAEIVDEFSPLLENVQKSTIVSDMNDLWLSLELLDSETIWTIMLAYVNWKWLEDVIMYLASKVRSSKLDNYIKNILCRNWVLNSNVEYDWDTVDMAISKQAAMTYIKKRQYYMANGKPMSNLSPEEIRKLSNALFNSKVLSEFTDRDFKIQFVKAYVDQQFLFKSEKTLLDDFIKWQEYKLKLAVNNYKAQAKAWQLMDTSEAIAAAINASDWIYSKHDRIVESLTQYFIEDVFKRNYKTADEDFINKIKSAVEKQLDEDRVVVLEQPVGIDDANKGFEFITEIAWLPDSVRFLMADNMYKNNVIWKWVYNYLRKIDPTVTVLNGDNDIWLLWAVIVKQFDAAMWDSINTVTATPWEKIALFLDIYRYYATWWHSYEWLINALEQKYQNNSSMIPVLQELKLDMEYSKNGIFSQDLIDEINKAPEATENAEDNPYNVFIRKIEPAGANIEDTIISALKKQYYANTSAFNVIMKYAPRNIKNNISEWMVNTNDKEHWSNIALWMVMSFLSAANNKEILTKIAMDLANQESTEWVPEQVNALAREIIQDWNDDTIMWLPAITEQLHRATWINNLDLSKWTVLYVWDKWWEYKPASWDTLDWKQTFPLKAIASLDDLNANVNIIVPEWISVPTKFRQDHNIVRVRAGIKDSMLVRSPESSYKHDLDAVWNTISWLWKVWHDVSIQEWFTFTNDEISKLKQKKLTKNFYWRIYNEILVPSFPSWAKELSQRDFNAMINSESMQATKLRLIQAAIASKSMDDKINAATILINQVTNWKLALQTDIEWTTKSINMEWAAQQFEEMINKLLDPKDENYNMQKKMLWNFFAAYYSSLMSMSHPTESPIWSWVGIDAFYDLSVNYQAAMWLLKQLWEDKWYPTSKYAYLRWENALERKDEKITDTIWEVMTQAEIDNEFWEYLSEALWDYVNDYDSTVDAEYEEAQDTWYDQIEHFEVEDENFEDKDAIVFATLFNDTIVDNLYDVEDYNIHYDEDGSNKFISKNLLWLIRNETWEIVSSESVLDMENASKKEDAVITIWDMLALQTIISCNEWSPEELETFLDQIFQVADWTPDTAPVKALFEKAKSEIMRDTNNTANVLKKLISNDLLKFDVISTTMTTTQKFNKSKTKAFKRRLVDTIFKYNTKPVSQAQLDEIKKEFAEFFTDKQWNKLPSISDDQVKAANEIRNMWNDREWENKRTLYVPWLAWVWKTTTLWAALKAIQKQEWAYWDDASRIEAWTQTAITDNFSNEDARILDEFKKNPDKDYYVKVHNKWKDIRVRFKWMDIITHDQLEDYTEDWVVNEFWESLWWVWPKDWILRLLEIWEWNKRFSPDWKYNRSKTRYLIKNISTVDENWNQITEESAKAAMWNNKIIEVRWLGNNIPRRPEQKWPDKIEWTSRLKNIYILTKTHSTVQSINDVMWDNWLVWVNSATMDSRLTTKSSSWFWLYWYWASSEIRQDKELENCLIIIDESQNTDDPTIQAIINWYSDKNQMVFLWDPHQISQGSTFASKVASADEEVLPLDSLFRWTPDIQSVNKLNALWQNDIIESWYVAIIPEDSNDFKAYDNLEDVFDLKWTTMYSVQTNERAEQVNREYFEWATWNKGWQVTKIISWWQTWADKAWLQIAKTLWIATWWTAPKWWKTENWADESLQEFWLSESETDNYMERTKKNVDDSDWTIILAKDINSSWTKNTIDYANSKNKPVFIIQPTTSPEEIRSWLVLNDIKTLNVAGNRWSKFKTWEIKVYWKILKDALDTWIKSKGSKPIPTMVIDSIMINQEWKQVQDKAVMNKRNHQWINLWDYNPEVIDGKQVYKKESDDSVEVFVPVLKDTKTETVKPIMTILKKQYPKKKIQITATAFAVTTKKQSWKTVDNIILDWEITSPKNDFYWESNTRQAYDSFTRWDKKVYYPADSKRILFAPIEQIKELVDNNNPNISFTAPSEEVATTEKRINIPIFYANDWVKETRDKLNTIIELLGENMPFEEVEYVQWLIDSLESLYAIEQSYNLEQLQLDRKKWTRWYWDKMAEWNWTLLKWIQIEIAQFFDKYKGSMEIDESNEKDYESLAWWVYGKEVNTPNIPSWSFFTSVNASQSKYSFELLSKSNKALKDWSRWMFFNVKKTINAKWKEVYTVVPAEVTWNKEYKPWILTSWKDQTKGEKKFDTISKRLNEYWQAFTAYQQAQWEEQTKNALSQLVNMINTDLAAHVQEEDLYTPREVSTYNWLDVDPEWLKKFWIDRIDDSVISDAMTLAYRQPPVRDADWHIIPDSDQYNLAQTLLNRFSWITDSEWNPITLSDVGKIIKTRVLRGDDVVPGSERTINSYEELVPNSLMTNYNSIKDRLAQWDTSDYLKEDLIAFIRNINSIDMREWMTVWQNEQDNIYIKDMMISCDDEFSCKL